MPPPIVHDLLTQPMDFEQLIRNYTNASFSIDAALFPDHASFADLSTDAALLASLKTKRIRTSACNPPSKTPAPPAVQTATPLTTNITMGGDQNPSWMV